jgi:hypothetical protein
VFSGDTPTSEELDMKIRVEMEIDLKTGTYDVRFQNVSHPGNEIDLTRLSKVVSRVLDNVVVKSTEVDATPVPQTLGAFKADIN